MKHILRRPGASPGFSLLEVMIAVVVLATGLLALAALQGSLTRSSSEAKIRGRVAAMLSARMDELRSLGYGNAALAPTAAVTTTSTTDPCNDGDSTDWMDCTRAQAGLSTLAVTREIHVWSSAIGAANFTVDRVAATNEPEFKRITLRATWTDAGGTSHSLGTASDASSLALSNDLLPPITSSSSNTVSPVVRQNTPVTDGMIPIAIGGGSDTAATNPKPIIVGSNSAIAETAFNVLTYHNEGGSVVRVQQRVETRVVGCNCKYGAESSDVFLGQDYRPTTWNGTQYKRPEKVTTDPVNSGKNPLVTGQSDVCDQCCRDHNDPSTLANDKPKFDPKRWNANSTEAQKRYLVTNLIKPVTGNNAYNESCRVIRVNGLWRVASDAYQDQMGYLATGPYDPSEDSPYTVNKRPDPLYADYYEEFVIDYLDNLFVGPSDGLTANQRYNTFNLDYPSPPSEPNGILVKASGSVADARYLHARGLYVDYIEPDAQQQIDDALTSCDTAVNSEAECVLPHIPFTTINLTQLADFNDSPKTGTVLIVGNNVTTRGEVNGTPGAANGQFADALLTARQSNTGLTGSLPIDDADSNLTTVDGDRVASSDNQKFTIANSIGTSGAPFTVQLNLESPLMNDGVSVNNPYVNWQTSTGGLGCRQTADALSPNPYTCQTDSALGVAASVLVTNYHYKDSDTPSVTCPNADPAGTFQSIGVSPTPRPVCKRFAVSGASSSLGGILSGFSVISGLDKYVEMTQINFTPLPANALITVEFTAQTDLANTAPVQCNYGQNADLTYYISSVVWVDPCD